MFTIGKKTWLFVEWYTDRIVLGIFLFLSLSSFLAHFLLLLWDPRHPFQTVRPSAVFPHAAKVEVIHCSLYTSHPNPHLVYCSRKQGNEGFQSGFFSFFFSLGVFHRRPGLYGESHKVWSFVFCGKEGVKSAGWSPLFPPSTRKLFLPRITSDLFCLSNSPIHTILL